MQKRIAPFGATTEQKNWLDNEAERTGNSQASIMRKLIQKEIDNFYNKVKCKCNGEAYPYSPTCFACNFKKDFVNSIDN